MIDINIETQRLLIRNFKRDDAKALYEILGDDVVMKYSEKTYSFEKTVEFLNDFCIKKNGALAVIHKESLKVIGYVLFHETDEKVYEIGWFFNKNCWGKGYAFESCKALVDYAFESLNVHKIFAETIDAVKSINLMKKLGMKLEGVQRSQKRDNSGNWVDLYLYGILKEDFGEYKLVSSRKRKL